jgi:hypothetical protein
MTSHSQSAGGGWRLAGTEGNLSLLLYHGSTVGRPSTSPWGSGDPKTESEPLLLSSEPLGTLAPPEVPLLPEELPPCPFAGFFEEEAIAGEQRREEQKKEKKKKKGRKKRSSNLLVTDELSVSREYGKRLSNGGN